MQHTVSASDSPEILTFPPFSAVHHDLPNPKGRDVVFSVCSEAPDVKYNSPSCFLRTTSCWFLVCLLEILGGNCPFLPKDVAYMAAGSILL